MIKTTKNLKIFLVTVILSLPFWWGVNNLETVLKDFYFWHEFAQNPQLLAAQANQLSFEENLRDLMPLREGGIEDLEVKARSAISVFIDAQGQKRILFEKNVNQKLPIASLTKLMTANVILEDYDLEKEITISQAAVEQEEDLGKLAAGKVFKARYLLYPLLMESSNDAAFSLANDYPGMTEEKFVSLMNEKAQELGLQDTFFVNVTGLDSEKEEVEEDNINLSTSQDLAKFAAYLLETKALLWEILTTPQYNSYGSELFNTNQLLGEMSGIVGGKTGYTEKASSCFLLVLWAPKGKGYLVNVILGTEDDRFSEMERLVNWVKETYTW